MSVIAVLTRCWHGQHSRCREDRNYILSSVVGMLWPYFRGVNNSYLNAHSASTRMSSYMRGQRGAFHSRGYQDIGLINVGRYR